MQLTSKYDGTYVTVNLDSSVTFTWNFTGELRIAEWGTKKSGVRVIDDNLLTLQTNGPQSFNVPLYNGRVNGSWNGKSPGQVTFTLTSIKEVDNRMFLFIFKPKNLVAENVFDKVQLIVRGKT